MVAEQRAGPLVLLLRATMTLGLVAGIALAARFPVGEEPEGAALRFALRTTQARVEICREPTAEEQASQPVHMRQREICEERTADFELEVRVDGENLLEKTVRPSGVRRTRPLAIEETILVPAGRLRVEAGFEPARSTRAWSEVERAQLVTTKIDVEVDLAPGEIALFTLDEAGRLRRVASGARESDSESSGEGPGHQAADRRERGEER